MLSEEMTGGVAEKSAAAPQTARFEPMPVRIRFQKTGKLQFISHLDLCRTLKTAFIRSGVPIWYSEGFNPHPKMVFPLPLSIGCESLCELMDIKITSPMPFDEIAARLGGVLTEELKITEAYAPENKFSEIGWAEYSIHFDGEPRENFIDAYKSPFMITKKTKSGERELDAAPLIRRVSYDGGAKRLDALLSAESERYLNPEFLAAAAGCPDYSIIRTAVYLRDGATLLK